MYLKYQLSTLVSQRRWILYAWTIGLLISMAILLKNEPGFLIYFFQPYFSEEDVSLPFFFNIKIYFSTLVICYMKMYILKGSKKLFCLFLSKSGEDMAA